MQKTISDTKVSVSYEDVHSKLDKLIAEADHEAFDLAMGCVISNAREGDALAMFIVAAPSSGKTEFIEAMSGVKWTYKQSELTPRTFLSGLEVDESGKERSLLIKLSDDGIKCILNKEFTTVLTKRTEDRNEILSQLREVMDGHISKDFGTGKRAEWSGKLGFLVGVTPAIDSVAAAQANLGERWMWLRLEPSTNSATRRTIALAALEGESETRNNRRQLQSSVSGHMSSLQELPEPIASTAAKEFIATTAELVSRGRTPVLRDGKDRVIEALPVIEGPARIAKAMLRLAIGVALVRGHDEVLLEDLQAVLRVAEDSVPVDRLAVFRLLKKHGMTVKELRGSTGFSETKLRRVLEELRLLDIAQSATHEPSGAGKPAELWQLSDNN